MKKYILISVLMLGGAVCGFARNVKVSLPGNAYVIKGEKYAALEIDGKVVIPESKSYFDFTSPDGKYFIGEFLNGTFRLFDRNGNGVQLGGLHYFYKLSIIDGTIVAQMTEDSQPKYYSEDNPAKELKVHNAGADFFDKGRDFNPEKMTRDKAIEQAKALSAQVPEYAKFEIRQKANSSRQELVVNGKILAEVQEFTVVSDEAHWQKTHCWVLIAKNKGYYGAFILETLMQDGEQTTKLSQIIPYEYTFGRRFEDTKMLSFTTRSSVRHFFNLYGWEFNYNYVTFTPTYRRWVYDAATGKWSLVKQNETAEAAIAEVQPEKEKQPAANNAGGNSAAAQTVAQTAQEPAKTQTAEFEEEPYSKIIRSGAKSETANLMLEEIAIGKTQTRLKLVFVSPINECYTIYRPGDSRCFRLEAGGKTFILKGMRGMKFQGEGSNCLTTKESITFYLYFDALPENLKTFNLTEPGGAWVINGIKLKKGFFDKLNDALDDVNKALE